MNSKKDFLKTILYLIFLLNINSGIYAKNFGLRCKRPKAYSFCGAHTSVGTQWFFDSKHSKCLPYKFCLTNQEVENPQDSKDNRFEDEMECVYVCKLNKPPPRKRKDNRMDHLNDMNEGENRDSLVMDRLMRKESKNPYRCMKPKSYSFCGSHTIPRVHWYYNKHHKRCFPYNYCENIEESSIINNENNFYSEKQCSDLCHFH